MNLAQKYQDASPGELITFGAYPHTAGGADRTPIRWRVLHNAGGELFLVSAYILDCKRYHGASAQIKWRDSVDITWRDCDLRRWLNDEFYSAAFTDAEKELIRTTHNTDNGAGSPETKDRVFLLSVAEVREFSATHGKDWLRAVGTDFAKTKKPDGCSLYVYDKSNKENYLLIDGREVGCSWWWLRTQGNQPSRACFVGTGASVRHYANVSLARDGVRPALRISLSTFCR